MIKIVFIDFDNTLYSHLKKAIPDSTKEAIRLVQAKGTKVFLCTGRNKCEFIDFDLCDVKFDGMICCNGQIAYKGDEKIFATPINNEAKDFIVNKFSQKVVSMLLVEEDKIYLNFVNETTIRLLESVSTPIPEISEYSGNDIYLTTLFLENKEDIDVLSPIFDKVKYTFWSETGVDVSDIETTKAIGISKVLNYYGIDKNEAMAFGDGENDIEMLKYVGIGVAMGNSGKLVKDSADYVTTDIDDDGLYKAFKKYNLI